MTFTSLLILRGIFRYFDGGCAQITMLVNPKHVERVVGPERSKGGKPLREAKYVGDTAHKASKAYNLTLDKPLNTFLASDSR